MRVNIYKNGRSGRPYLAGWFDKDAAEKWTDMDHNNNGSGGFGRGQAVLRTAQGRWVLENWTCWHGEEDVYEYITDDQAKDWLLRNECDDAVREYFGEIEEEVGPGRPEVGNAVHVRLGELLGPVDEWAAKKGLKRAEAIRQLVAAGLGEAD